MNDPHGASLPACPVPDPRGTDPTPSGAGFPARAVWCWCALGLALALGLGFRVAALDARPMHHDEANQAIRFGQLLETGEYRYDAADHHGPTLYYLTLPAAWLRGQHDTASLDEWTVRAVPALFGVGTILLLLALAGGIGRTAVVIAAAFMAVAPPLVYYSRFYIQESLLLFFTLGFLVAAGRYALSFRPRDAWWAGAFAGLALATKETAIILLPAAVIACVVARLWSRTEGAPSSGAGSLEPGAHAPSPSAGPVWIAGALAVAIAAVFYSSFFTNLQGLAEPFRAAGIYFARGLDPDAHREPWYYYLRLIYRTPIGHAGFDLGLLVLVIPSVRIAFGSSSAAGTSHWARILLVYAVIVTVVYSALPYKTPWNLLPFYGVWVILAGIGAAEPLDRTTSRSGWILIAAGVVAVCATLGVQAWRTNFLYPADPRNPYAYVHTSPDVVRLAGRVKALASLHPDRERMLVAVVAGPYEQWPLPWYLRRMPRVGYWTTTAAAGPVLGRAPVVIASPANAAAVEAALGERYQPEIYGLRPDVLMSVFVERSLWDRFVESVK